MDRQPLSYMKHCLLPLLLILCAGKPIINKNALTGGSQFHDKVVLRFYDGKHLPLSSIKETRTRLGKDFALFFATDTYDNSSWPNLNNSVKDAREIAKDLEYLYGFNTEVVTNPTRIQVLEKLVEYTKKIYPDDAQLLIFFTGHGYYVDLEKDGFLIPRDGKSSQEDNDGDSWLEYTDLRQRIKKIPCPHILLAIDAGFSGSFDEKVVFKNEDFHDMDYPAEADAERTKRIADLLHPRTRLCITSGEKNYAAGSSEFADQFKLGLHSLGGTDGLLNIQDMYCNYLKKAKSNPQIGDFKANESNSTFLFDYRGSPAAVARERDQQAWQVAKEQNTEEAYQDYRQQFPTGEFALLADEAIAKLSREKLAERAWVIARARNTKDAYLDYLHRYPDSNYRNEAIERLRELERSNPHTKPTLPVHIRPFPWPPPRCAERYTILKDFKSRFATLSAVDQWICSALDNQGYGSRSYYSLPNGFALVTRMEQFNKENGQCLSEAKRWVDYPLDDKDGGIIDYLSSIILPRKGFFRVFVFAVTDQPTGFSDKQVDRAEVQEWLEKGVSILPDKEKNTAVTNQHFVDVLVYEFETQDSNRKSKRRCPCGMLCTAHLERSGLKKHLR